MGNGNNGDQTSILLGILFSTVLVLTLLALLAHFASDEFIKSIDQAVEWAKDFLGVAAILAGFFGISTGTIKGLADKAQVAYATGGMFSILAGATLLEAGGGPVPIALAIASIGIGTVFLQKYW